MKIGSECLLFYSVYFCYVFILTQNVVALTLPLTLRGKICNSLGGLDLCF